MMADSGYNGWSNYETWCANVEFADDWCEWKAVDIENGDAEKFATVGELRSAMKDAFHELLDDEGTSGMVKDWAERAASRIDWWEIARHSTERLVVSEEVA